MKTTSLLIALALAGTAPVFAQTTDATAHAAEFAKADTDGDGKLSRAEAVAANPNVAAEFDKIDTNGDGYITPDEDLAALQKPAQ